ncbi:divalent metal cation transporter [Pseudoflavonifractor phocaeensis]|uniref:NRAMP family divalent metal transporter n=1 Tax=Pseudoflavonifractor phocaeensis TaxID=1870988 RepID=UPI0025A3AA54|nr:NRAMP family divalent metal transporter [Pseudoflavonifractor phocaeensis]MDM8239479.1 divalent metal cation transporter [Pseudoflavonifractor phocaeensis]
MSNQPNTAAVKPSRSVLFGAAFLMATSAIGPGFLTQTSTFTAQHGAALALVIVLAIVMDITAQMNIWSVVTVSKMRAQDVANKLLPGLGVIIAILVAIGGLAFNVGNVGGVALGFNAMIGLDQKVGAVVAGCLGIIIFINKNAKTIMDKVATILAAIILITVLVVAIISEPPLGEVGKGLVDFQYLLNPETNMFTALTTLLGGSCGGYIAFSGAHRLLDAGISGPENIGHVRKSVLQGCGTSGAVRILLFLAVLGTCMSGTQWLAENAKIITDAATNGGNPAAEAFRLAAGDLGYRLFGLCLFSAGVSSVVGAAYTSVSFLKTLHPFIAKYERQFVVGFIAFSTLMMVIVGNAAALLIIAGAFNGLILPVTLGVMLFAGHKASIVGSEYKHPMWLTILGAIVVVIALYSGVQAVPGIMALFG